MRMSNGTKLIVSWCGALIMEIIFISIMLTEQYSIERYYRAQQRVPARAKVVRMRPRNQNSKKQYLVAR